MKKSEQKLSVKINVSPEKAWEIIGAVDGVNNWLEPIQACRVEGDKRYCTTAEGSFTENILKVDNDNRELYYEIPEQQMIPVKNIVGLMRVIESDDNNSVIDWEWKFDVEENLEDQAKEMLAGVGQLGIQGIESLILSGSVVN